MVLAKTIKRAPLVWNEIEIEDNEGLFIYKSKWKEHELLLRINDFPDEVLYTLFLDKKPIFNLDDFPDCWKKK